MQEYLVSMDVVSDCSLDELTRRIGIAPDSASSHDKGARRGLRKAWDRTIWRVCSSCSATASLADHIESVLSKVSPTKLKRKGVLPSDALTFLNIGVLPTLGAFNVSLELSPAEIAALARAGLGLDVTVYPGESGRVRER